MNTHLLIALVATIGVILFRLGTGDFFFFTNPEVYLVPLVGYIMYRMSTPKTRKNCVMIQIALSVGIPYMFSQHRGF